MIETKWTSTTSSGATKSKTITLRPGTTTTTIQPQLGQKNQQIIVIPHNMLVNGCISAKDLKNIINDTPKTSIKNIEARPSLKRSLPALSVSDSSAYGSDDCESNCSDEKSVRKRANLDHLSPDEKLMRRKLKNRVAAQNARDKKRVKMEDMEGELERIMAHAKALEAKNAQLVAANQRLVAENDILRPISEVSGQVAGAVGPPVMPRRSPESAAGTGSALGRWINSQSLDHGLEVALEHPQGHQEAETIANQETGIAMADLVADIIPNVKTEYIDEDTKACELILDNLLKTEVDEDSPATTNTILDTAWEETFSDLFPDLDSCTYF